MKRSAWILAACAAPRLLYLWASGVPLAHGSAWVVSDGLLTQHALVYGGVPSALFEPLYPIFVAAIRWLTSDAVVWIMVAQIFVSAAGGVLLDRLARDMSGSNRAGAIAAACYAGYPYLIRQSISWLTTPLVSTLLLGAWLAWARRQWVGCAAWLALATLTRAVVLPIGVIATVLMFRLAPRRDAAVAAALFGLMLSPWIAYNYRVDGTLLPSRNGEDLYAGNNIYAVAMIPRQDLDTLHGPLEDQVLRETGGRLSPAALNHEYIRRATAFMAEDPWRTLRLKLANLVYFYSPRIVPFEPRGDSTEITLEPDGSVRISDPRVRPRSHEIAHAVAYTVVFTAAIVGWSQRRKAWRTDALLLVSVAVFTAAGIVYFPTTYVRAPIDPIFMAYAGGALARLTASRARSRSRSGPAAPLEAG